VQAEAGQRPFWSVMITVYDRIGNLARVLPSVLAQADDDMQIEVLCDGGDPERQRAAAAEVVRLGGGRIGLHAPTERLGHPHIFNRALERARGEWVHILHDDDWLEPGFYSGLRAVIDAHPEAGAAFCQQRIAHQGAEANTPWISWVERETPGLIDDWLGRIAVECRLQFSAMAVRRCVYEALGGFCLDAGSAFDWEMWIRIAAAHPVAFVPEVLANIGRDASAESSGLANSGAQVRDALTVIDLAAPLLPAERATALGAKARDRIAAYALEVAERCLERGDAAAALANLRAAMSGQPSPRTLRALTELLQGEPHVFRG
jgi:glycosyltransferase involved in cell wall biosynthesis